MGAAKRMCIMGHMSHHSMQLKLALRIACSPFLEVAYQVDMFIPRTGLFVNRKFSGARGYSLTPRAGRFSLHNFNSIFDMIEHNVCDKAGMTAHE